MSKLPEWSDADFATNVKTGAALVKFWAEW